MYILCTQLMFAWGGISTPRGNVPIARGEKGQLRAAVDRSKKSLRKVGDEVHVPMGLMTSYPTQ